MRSLAFPCVFRKFEVGNALRRKLEVGEWRSPRPMALLPLRTTFAVVVLTVPKEDRRRFLMMAHEMGMTKGDYVFYTMELLPEENVLDPEDVWASNDGRNAIAKQAFEAVFHVCCSSLLLYLVFACFAGQCTHYNNIGLKS